MDLEVQLGNNPKFCSLLSVRLKQDLSGVNLFSLKRWFCTSKQTFVSFFAFLAEILKSPLCTRCMQRSEISLN